MDVAGQRSDPRDLCDVELILEDRLVEVGDRPALGDREVKEWRELGAGRSGDVVPPGPERRQQLPVAVERDVAVHHPADAHRGNGSQVHRVPGPNVRQQRRVAIGEAGPDVRQVVGPDAVDEPVLPAVPTGRERGRVGRDQRRLDPCRAELDPEDRAAHADQLCSGVPFHRLSPASRVGRRWRRARASGGNDARGAPRRSPPPPGPGGVSAPPSPRPLRGRWRCRPPPARTRPT